MKKLLVLLVAVLCAFSALAEEPLNASDTGTYVVLDNDYKPVDIFYRLSQRDGQWVADGKMPNGNWTNVSCDPGCAYRDSNEAEIRKYFPPGWFTNTNIACIQNLAQAFCRFSLKDNPSKRGYVIIALTRGQPIPFILRRVAP